MEIPDFVCSLICSGLNISNLLDGRQVEDPPEEPIEFPTPQIGNPHMASEEGLHLNTFRSGYDARVPTDRVASVSNDYSVSKL